MDVRWYPLQDGDAGIIQTLAVMESQASGATADPLLVETVRRLVRGLPNDPLQQTHAIYDWVKAHYIFTPDPRTYDLMLTPHEMLLRIDRDGFVQEDCESVSTLLAAMFQAVGIATRFRVLSRGVQGPGDTGYQHVFVEALIGGQWTPFDATLDIPGGARPALGAHEATFERGTLTREDLTMYRNVPGLGYVPATYFTGGYGGRTGLGDDGAAGPTSDNPSYELTIPTTPPLQPTGYTPWTSPTLEAGPEITNPDMILTGAPAPVAGAGLHLISPLDTSMPTLPGMSTGIEGPTGMPPQPSAAGTTFGTVINDLTKLVGAGLPLLERYGVFKPQANVIRAGQPRFLPLPGQPALTAYPGVSAALQSPYTPLIIGAGVLLVIWMLSRR